MTRGEDTNDHTHDTETGPGSSVGERITGEPDSRDPDGLITLDDLPNRTGKTSDLGDLISKASQYGDPKAEDTEPSQEN